MRGDSEDCGASPRGKQSPSKGKVLEWRGRKGVRLSPFGGPCGQEVGKEGKGEQGRAGAWTWLLRGQWCLRNVQEAGVQGDLQTRVGHSGER